MRCVLKISWTESKIRNFDKIRQNKVLQNYTIFLGLSDFTKKIKRGFQENEILGSEWVKSFVKLIQLSMIIVRSIFPTFYKNLRSLTTFANKIRETKALNSRNFCKCLPSKNLTIVWKEPLDQTLKIEFLKQIKYDLFDLLFFT